MRDHRRGARVARGVLLVLAVPACLAGAVAGVGAATRVYSFGVDLMSLALAAVLIAVGVGLVYGVLAAVDGWIERGNEARAGREHGGRPRAFTSQKGRANVARGYRGGHRDDT